MNPMNLSFSLKNLLPILAIILGIAVDRGAALPERLRGDLPDRVRASSAWA